MLVRVCERESMIERERECVRERERGREKRVATKLLHNIISTHARKTLNDDLPIVVSDASVRIDRFSKNRIAFSTSWFCQFQLDCNNIVIIYTSISFVAIAAVLVTPSPPVLFSCVSILSS